MRCGIALGVTLLASFQALANEPSAIPGGASVATTASAKTTIRTGVRLSWSLDDTLRIVAPNTKRRVDITRNKVVRETNPSGDDGKPNQESVHYVDFS